MALDGFNAGLGECLSSPFVIETAATCLDGVESFVGGVDENCHAGKQLLVIQRGRGKKKVLDVDLEGVAQIELDLCNTTYCIAVGVVLDAVLRHAPRNRRGNGS